MLYHTKFRDLAIGAKFLDEDGDLCHKVDSNNAKTPYCAPGFLCGFRHNEEVTPQPFCYRLKQPNGWMLIGADDTGDAMRIARANQFWSKETDLQVWNGEEFVSYQASGEVNLQTTERAQA